MKTERSWRQRLLAIGLSGLVVLVLWEAGARLMGLELIFPGPGRTLQGALGLLAEPAFWTGVGQTFLRVLTAFLLGLVVCLPLGILMGRSAFAWDFLQLGQAALRSAPVISVILLALLWFPDAGQVAVFVAFLMVFPILLTAIAQGSRTEDPQLLEMARVFRFSPWRRLVWLTLPWLRPFLLSAGKTALGVSWKAVAAAEVLAQPRYGIGSLMQDGRLNLETDRVFALTVVIILLSVLGDLVWEGLFRLVDALWGGPAARTAGEATGTAGEATGTAESASDGGCGEALPPASPGQLASPDSPADPADLVAPGGSASPGQAAGREGGGSTVGVQASPGPAAAQPPALLQVRRLCFAWEAGRPILEDWSASLPAGQIAVLMGPSGRGKTTLVRLLAGLERPDAGSIGWQAGTGLSVVFQEHRLLPWCSVARNALLAAPRGPADGRSPQALLAELAQLLEIRAVLHQRPGSLSGGMRQRASLLRSLYAGHCLGGRAAYLWDEPFQSLDQGLKQRLLPRLAGLVSSGGRGGLIITHHPEDLAHLGGSLLRLELPASQAPGPAALPQPGGPELR